MVYGPIAAFLVELFPTQIPLPVDVLCRTKYRATAGSEACSPCCDGIVAKGPGTSTPALWYPTHRSIMTS